jgi:hypothetical protein
MTDYDDIITDLMVKYPCCYYCPRCRMIFHEFNRIPHYFLFGRRDRCGCCKRTPVYYFD